MTGLKNKTLIILSLLLLAHCTLSGCGNSNNTPSTVSQEERDISVEVSESQVIESISEDVEKVEEAEIVEETKKVSDMEIITREGHPTYYGSVEKSHEVWDDVESGKIHFGDKNYGYHDSPILVMDSARNSDFITNVIINFSNFEEEIDMSVEEALPIAASYTPFDAIEQAYVFRGSEKIVPDDESKKVSSYYVFNYSLENKDVNDQYQGSITIILEEREGSIANIDFTFSKPRWMYSLEKNSYHKEAWDYDLIDYR